MQRDFSDILAIKSEVREKTRPIFSKSDLKTKTDLKFYNITTQSEPLRPSSLVSVKGTDR